MNREGMLVVLSGPSGTGKGTLLKRIQEKNANIRLSVSVTTRKPRNGEVEGQNYFFRSADEFRSMIEKDELIEWDVYCENYYGTPVAYVKDTLKAGYDVVLEITVEGALHIKDKFPDSIMIFVLPPSFEELRKRIVERGTETTQTIEKRLDTAKREIGYVDKYEYAVINDRVDDAVEDINSIIRAEKLRYKYNSGILKDLGL